MITNIAILVPIHPPHFEYARDLLVSLSKKNLDQQAHIWFVFTNEKERDEFGYYPYLIVLPEELRIFVNRGIINIKKFYGLRQIQDKYSFVIVMDAESLFIRNVDLFHLCEEYFNTKILLGNEVRPEDPARIKTENIKNSCRRFFTGHPDFEKLNNPLYLWFNQPCIYKTSTLPDFWSKIDYDNNIKNLTWFDFDYYCYMFYLILEQEFRIEDMGIKSNYGVCEATTEDLLFFKNDNYKKLTILISSQGVLHKFDNLKLFLAIHLDRNKDWILRSMEKRIDRLMLESLNYTQKINNLENEICNYIAIINEIKNDFKVELDKTNNQFSYELNRAKDEFKDELNRVKDEFKNELNRAKDEFKDDFDYLKEEIRLLKIPFRSSRRLIAHFIPFIKLKNKILGENEK